MSTLVNVKHVFKTYTQGDVKIEVLKDVSLTIQRGETVSIVGPSGGGKSTLLSILSGVDRPTAGQVTLEDRDFTQMSEDERTDFRGKNIGIVFQQFHLIQHLTALENVLLPLEILGASDSTAAETRAVSLLQEVGLGDRLSHLPSQLSGGEAQRVAIARALIHQPKLLLADEPSGNLDLRTGAQVMDLLFELVDRHQSTLILVTHNPELAQRARMRWVLTQGQLTK